jgi:hypothetical protein
LVRFLGRQSEQSQYVFCDAICGRRVVAIRLLLQELAEPEERPSSDGQGQFGIVNGESAGGDGRRDVP